MKTYGKIKFLGSVYLMFENYSTFRAMCMIDFGLPVDQDDGDLLNAQESMAKNLQSSLKRKHNHRKNFEILQFRDPVLFLAHPSKNSLLLIDRPWLEVAKSLETPPVHRHIFGT